MEFQMAFYKFVIQGERHKPTLTFITHLRKGKFQFKEQFADFNKMVTQKGSNLVPA